MSGGQRQRLALAAAVLHEPELLFLDEPTSAVDPQSRRDFWESLFALVERGTTILVSTHYMDEAERCHRLAILSEGRLAAEGVPIEMMRGIAARVVEVEAPDAAGARRALLEDAALLGSTQLGLRLRVLLRPDVVDPAGHVGRRLAAAGSRRAGRRSRREPRGRVRDGDRSHRSSRCGRRSRPEPTMLARIAAIASKEWRQLGRDRLSVGLIAGIPLMQILLFGYAINFDVRELRAAVVDEAGTSGSRALIGDLQASGVVRFEAPSPGVADLQARLDRGEISVGIVIPPDFERRGLGGERPFAQILVDGSEPMIDSVARNLAQTPLPARRGLANAAPVRFEIRTLYNPERRTAVQIVPALIGVILSMTMVIFTSVSIVRERERGNLELLITTPVRPWELMAGKLVPYVFIGLLQTTLILGVGAWLFDVPFVGRLGDLYLAAALFIAATLTLGLVISTFASTQFQAFQLAFVTMLPSILLSGFMFPFDGMPRLAQGIAQVLPLTHFNDLVRGIVLRGAPLAELGTPVLKLALFLGVGLAIATLRFHKRLD